MNKKYKTILADPPWAQGKIGKYKKYSQGGVENLPYKTMTVDDIINLPVEKHAEIGCHLWLWTTNEYLEAGFKVLRGWGFTYLAPITWSKPNGMGAWFQHRTQTILFGYYKKCEFNKERYKPTIFETGIPKIHSRKPAESYRLIESISETPRLELFARPHSPMFPKLPNWDVWGNEMPENDIELIGEKVL